PEVFLDAAGHGEPEMRVAVDEPGEHRLSASLHALGAGPRAIDLRGGADGHDAIVIHDDGGLVMHGAGSVRRDDGGVADHERPPLSPARARAFPAVPTPCPRHGGPSSSAAPAPSPF